MFVKLSSTSGWESHTLTVHFGIPQGNHLGPLLLILILNNVVKCFKFRKSLLFADDLKLFKTVKNLRDASVLHRDLNDLSSWCQRNRSYC